MMIGPAWVNQRTPPTFSKEGNDPTNRLHELLQRTQGFIQETLSFPGTDLHDRGWSEQHNIGK